MRYCAEFFTDDLMFGIFLQVLLFSPSTNNWTMIGRMEIGRSFHEIAEVNLQAVDCVGNLFFDTYRDTDGTLLHHTYHLHHKPSQK